MNEMNDKWINDIRSRMDNYSEPLPAGLWEKIESEISTPAPKVIPLWRKWTSVAAAAMLILAVSTVSVWLWTSDPELKEANAELSETNELMQTPDDNLVLSDVIKTEEENESLLAETVSKADYPVNKKKQVGNANDLHEKGIDALPENVLSDYESINPEVETADEHSDDTVTEDAVSLKEKRMKRMKEDRETARRNASYLAMADNKQGKRNQQQFQWNVSSGNTNKIGCSG